MNKKRNDVILIITLCVILLCCTVIVWFYLVPRTVDDSSEQYLTIYLDGSVVKQLKMDQAQEYKLELPDKHYNRILVDNGKAYIIDADCKDQICVKHRPINRQSESIICLPHKLVITIEYKQNSAEQRYDNEYSNYSNDPMDAEKHDELEVDGVTW